jgi:hypothetical protein
MLKSLKPNLLLILFAALLLRISAEERLVGLKSLSFAVGVREIGMGEVGTASAEGPFSFYFNPALSAWNKKIGLGLTYSDWWLDTYRTALFFLHPTKLLNLGLGLIFFDYGKIELRRDRPAEAIGEYSPKDITLYFNLARSLSSKLTLGTSFRFFSERFYTQATSQWGLDLGFNYQGKNWQIGFSYLNWGDVLRLKMEKFYLPAEFRLGVSFFWLINNFSFRPAFDYTYSPYEGVGRVHLGGEVNFKEGLSLRLGYGRNAPAFGIGVKRGIFSFDYGCTIKKELPNPSHHFALRLTTSY